MATPKRPVRARRSTTFAPERSGVLDETGYIRPIQCDGEAEIVERDGVLRCSCVDYLDKSWCNHLQRAIVTSLDAMPKGTPESAHVEFVKYPNQMLIPMFPTKGTRDSGFQVVLLGAVEDDGSRAVRLVDIKNELDDPELLGWIFPGEGRYIIRTMILEWLRSKFRTVPCCKSPIHKSVLWSNADRERSSLEGRDLIDVLNLVKYSECNDCHQFSDPSADAPDL